MGDGGRETQPLLPRGTQVAVGGIMATHATPCVWYQLKMQAPGGERVSLFLPTHDILGDGLFTRYEHDLSCVFFLTPQFTWFFW